MKWKPGWWGSWILVKKPQLSATGHWEPWRVSEQRGRGGYWRMSSWLCKGHALEGGDKGQLGYGTQIRHLEREKKERSKDHPKGRTARSGIDSRETGPNRGKLWKHAERQAVQNWHGDYGQGDSEQPTVPCSLNGGGTPGLTWMENHDFRGRQTSVQITAPSLTAVCDDSSYVSTWLAHGVLSIWPNIILGFPVRVFLAEIIMWIDRLSKEVGPAEWGCPSSNELKAWKERKGWSSLNERISGPDCLGIGWGIGFFPAFGLKLKSQLSLGLKSASF